MPWLFRYCATPASAPVGVAACVAVPDAVVDGFVDAVFAGFVDCADFDDPLSQLAASIPTANTATATAARRGGRRENVPCPLRRERIDATWMVRARSSPR